MKLYEEVRSEMKFYLILLAKLNYVTPCVNQDRTESGISGVMCGTATQPLRYKFDIFNEDSEKISSYSPSDAPPIGRIFGGRQVKIGEVPWQANLRYPFKKPTIGWFKRLFLWIKKVLGLSNHVRHQPYYTFCGGVIVSNTKVITAAHCILSEEDGSFLSTDKIKVIAGHSSIGTARQSSGLHKYVLHP